MTTPSLKRDFPFARRDVECSIFYHLMMDRAFGRFAVKGIDPAWIYHPDIREAFEEIIRAARNGMDITEDQRCSDYMGPLASESAISLMGAPRDALAALHLQKVRRDTHNAIESMSAAINEPSTTSTAISETFGQWAEKISKLTADKSTTPPTTTRQALLGLDARTAELAGERSTVPTGIRIIDERLDIEPQDLVTIAARPGSGKSATLCTMYAHQVMDGKTMPGMLSLELPLWQVTMRVLSCITGIPYGVIKSGEPLHPVQQSRMDEARAHLLGRACPLSDQSAMTVDQIRDTARRWIGQHGCNILYIDQLSKIKMDAGRGSRFEKYSDTVNALKVMARELNIPIVLAAQQRRVEEGKSRPPQLSDLKDTGSLEEDSDIVIMPWRPESDGYDRPEVSFHGSTIPVAGKIFFFCRKYRNGEPWSAATEFDGPAMTVGRARV